MSYLVKRLPWRRKFRSLQWMLRHKGLWGPFPLYAKIEIEQRCNLKCPKCFRTSGITSNKFMTFDYFTEVIDKLEPGICEVWSHGYGEPTINPDFLNMMFWLRERGILWGLATNGATPFFDDITNITDLLVARPTKVRFSIDAADREIFEKERFPAKYDAVIGNIRRVVRERNFLYPHATRNRPRVDIYCVLTMDTIDQVGPMIKLRDELGCDWITFSDVSYGNDFGDSVNENSLLAQMSSKEMLEKFRVHWGKPNVNFAIPRPRKRTCDYPAKHVYISAEGDVYPCTCVPNKEPPMGNINDVLNINEIYDNDAWNLFREQSVTGHIPSNECFICLQWGPDLSGI